MDKPTFTENNEEMIKPKGSNRSFSPIKEQSDVNRKIGDLKQQLKSINEDKKELAKEQKKIRKSVESLILQRSEDAKLKKARVDELIANKDKIDNGIKVASQQSENLEQRKIKLAEEHEELIQKQKSIENENRNLQLLTEKLDSAEKVVQALSLLDFQHWNHEHIGETVNGLRKAIAEFGISQEEGDKLASIEERLNYFKRRDTFLKQCKDSLAPLINELQIVLENDWEVFSQMRAEAGLSEISHCSLEELFDQNEGITKVAKNLKEVGQGYQNLKDELRKKSNEILKESHAELKNLADQLHDSKLILLFFYANPHYNRSYEEEYNKRINLFNELFAKIRVNRFWDINIEKWGKKINKVHDDVIEVQRTSMPMNKDNLLTNLRNEKKRGKKLQEMEKKLKESEESIKKIVGSSLKESEEMIQFGQDYVDSNRVAVSFLNSGLRVFEAKYLKDYKDFVQNIDDIFSNIKIYAQEIIYDKTNENGKKLHSTKEAFKENKRKSKSIANNINECEHNIAKLKKELKKAKQEMDMIDRQSKDILNNEYKKLNSEEKGHLKDINAKIRELDNKASKLQKQLQDLELSQHPTKGEFSGQSSFVGQVVQGALDNLRQRQG